MDPTINHIQINDFTYHLPDERIAKFPLSERDQSKLLVYRNDAITIGTFARLPGYIGKEDLLVFNNTRVIRARIEMKKSTGARIEIFCLEPHSPSDYQLSFIQQQCCEWKCMVGNLKKWKSGILEKEVRYQGARYVLRAERLSGTDHYQVIRFSWDGGLDFGNLLDICGYTPIPPYLNRKTEEIDEIRYQTVYSKHKGSVAAPTAGLHFTSRVLEELSAKGVQQDEITLHVGAGTFRPVQHQDVLQHEMHVEFFSVRKEVILHILSNTGKITAVGTTSLRALESIYWIGVKVLQSDDIIERPEITQWEAYSLPQEVSLSESLSAILRLMDDTRQDILYASTQIMIVPGYRFRICKRLITNFHQPQSTLLLLVAAFTGNRWKDIYQFALENDFRFLSYGDSSMLEMPDIP